MKIRFYASLGLLALLASYGCGGNADIDRKSALEARDQAKSLHADTLAAKDFLKAQEVFDNAQATEKEGNIDAAKVLFSTARINFGKASDIAKSKSEALSRDLNSMKAMISEKLDQVKIDLASKTLSSGQKSQVAAIVAEVEKDNASIDTSIAQEDLMSAVETAKKVQTRIHHAQLILAGQKIK